MTSGNAGAESSATAADQLHDQPHQERDGEQAHRAEDHRDDEPLGALGHADEGEHDRSVGLAGGDRLDIDAIRARVCAATAGPWRWQGNIDTGEPYLASRAPGMGASVLAIGTEDRSTTGRAADDVRSYARDCDEDPEEMVEDWATDRYGEPIKEPRLWFYTDHLAVTARDHVTFEVAPQAQSREDRRVYRADITGIRHPDAEFIAHARTDVELLLAALDEAKAEIERLTDVAERNAAAYEHATDARKAAESSLAAVRALLDDPAESRAAVLAQRMIRAALDGADATATEGGNS